MYECLIFPQVREPWEVVGMDLIGPLRDTANKNQYILTMTDLYTKWVVADALQTKSGTEVATAIVSKLYLFGMVRKIITNQGKALVNEVRIEKPIYSTSYIIHFMPFNFCLGGLSYLDYETNCSVTSSLITDSLTEESLRYCTLSVQ